MTETATVKRIEGTTILVGCSSGERCETCTGGSFCALTERIFGASNPLAISLSPGDRVEVYIAPGTTILTSFLLFVVPLLFFVAGFLVSTPIFHLAGQLARVGVGFGALAIGFVFSITVVRRMERRRLPVVTSLLGRAESRAPDTSGRE
ncbi:MAG TPA: SoxR reducing system RseC family protein [Spirochaetia bacterium]|nr:SoxR reducing system RseC family protein [Spirochaetia bacterium]